MVCSFSSIFFVFVFEFSIIVNLVDSAVVELVECVLYGLQFEV